MVIVYGLIAVVLAYLIGSIPFAYIVTRLATGRDIRKLGGGNVGARNTFREVGLWAAVIVAIFDVGKGVAAVILAHRLLGTPQVWEFGAPQLFLMAAAVAAVSGHMWSVYLKFDGGNGLAATVGVLAVLMSRELLIALALTLLLAVIIRNIVLSVNISLLSVPISAVILEGSWLAVVFPIILAIILVLNFIPTAQAALAEAGSKENLVAGLFRGDKAEKEV